MLCRSGWIWPLELIFSWGKNIWVWVMLCVGQTCVMLSVLTTSLHFFTWETLCGASCSEDSGYFLIYAWFRTFSHLWYVMHVLLACLVQKNNKNTSSALFFSKESWKLAMLEPYLSPGLVDWHADIRCFLCRVLPRKENLMKEWLNTYVQGTQHNPAKKNIFYFWKTVWRYLFLFVSQVNIKWPCSTMRNSTAKDLRTCTGFWVPFMHLGQETTWTKGNIICRKT